MKNSKLIHILECFSPAELRDFTFFLSSGLVVSGVAEQRLLDYLLPLFPHFREEYMDKKRVFRACYGNKRYDDKTFRYLVTDLTKQCELFLAFSMLQKQKELKHNLLLRVYSERNCEKAYQSTLLALRKTDEHDVKDADFYYSRFETEQTHMSHIATYNKRNEENNMEAVAGHLDKFYLAKKLQLCCEMQNVKNIFSKKYEAFLLDEIMAALRAKQYGEEPIIIVYQCILMTLQESDNEKHFVQLKKLLLRYENDFSKTELREMYQYVLNYCIKKINTGKTGYQDTLLATYKIIIANKVILMKNKLSQWDYKNIVTISLRQKEFDWSHKFITEYKEYIAAPERENAYVYNLACWHFYRKEYSQALHLLQQVSFTDLYYQLDTRVIILKIYVEQDNDETLFYHISSFRVFLQRNKLVSDYQRVIYSNLLRYTQSLVKAAGNRKKIEALKQKIANNRQIADSQWLLKKIADA